MRIYFVRHGQSANNAAYQHETTSFESRVADPPLTPEGRLQAKAAGSWLFTSLSKLHRDNRTHQHQLPQVILTSPMIRALETADLLSKQFLSLPIIALPKLCEIGGLFTGPRILDNKDDEADNSKATERSQQNDVFHCPPNKSPVPGLSLSEMRQRFPSLSVAHHVTERGWWFTSRETHEDAISRAWDVTRQLWMHAVSYPYSSLIVISHGLFQDIILKTLIKSTGPSPASLKPMYDGFPISTTDSDPDRITLWPLFPTESPITHSELNESSYYNKHTHFLCNNVGISLIELSVIYPAQTPQPTSVGPDSSCSNVAKNELFLDLGILYWNQSSFLPEALNYKSGHELYMFSIF